MTRRDLLAKSVGAGALFTAPMLNLGRCRLTAGTGPEYSVRAVELVQGSTVIDMLGLLTLDWKKLGRWHSNPQTFTSQEFVPVRESGISIFNPAVDLNMPDAHRGTRRWLAGWNRFLAAQPDLFLPVLGSADIDAAKTTGRVGVLLGMQNADHFRSVKDVSLFHSMGQRLSQLTYNSANRYGHGCIDGSDRGLTELGFEIVGEMNRVGMIVDASHAGEQTSFDAFSASSKPVLITHSNCRALVQHPRCVSDDVIRAMAKSGGVLGITGIRTFVGRGADVSIENALDHFQHTARLVGVEHVGVGSDTDLRGRDRRGSRLQFDIAGLNHPRRIFDLTEGLIRRGFSNLDIQGILGNNFKRALNEIF